MIGIYEFIFSGRCEVRSEFFFFFKFSIRSLDEVEIDRSSVCHVRERTREASEGIFNPLARRCRDRGAGESGGEGSNIF